MSLEKSLVSLLGDVVGGRVFPDIAPIETDRPYLIYQEIGGGSQVDFMDNSLPDQRNTIVQLAVWEDTRLGASAVMDRVEEKMAASFELKASISGSRTSDYDDVVKRYGCLQDFNIWVAR